MKYDDIDEGDSYGRKDIFTRKYINIVILAALPSALLWLIIVYSIMDRYDIAVVSAISALSGGAIGWWLRSIIV